MSSDRRSFLARLPVLGAVPAAEAAPQSKSLVDRLFAVFDALEIVDTHEHTALEQKRLSEPADFFTLASHYLMGDAVSSGLPKSAQDVVNDRKATAAARWSAFEPWWRNCRFTGYGQALRTTIRDLYGVEEISAGTVATINERIAARLRPGLYRWVFKERARIRRAIVDDNYNAAPMKLDPEFFVPARKFDRFVTPPTPKAVGELEQLTGVSITSLGGLKQAMEKSFAQSVAVGMAAVKSTIAYNRNLEFREVSEADAARDFEIMMRRERPLPDGFRRLRERPLRNLEDHMFHHLVRLAEAHNYPVQVHTGLHAGPNFITNSNPTLLTNVFFLFPKVKFDLFHIGYPYQSELAVLAKMFPNVYVDFCWAHIIAPGVGRRALHECLETVPLNKIMGFGGDYNFAELSYGHAKMARRNIAQVLAGNVEAGIHTEDDAADIGRMLLCDNPLALFPLAK
ncbi:MAG: amidohydrolase family protein [Acidobacteriales bacterium]|nr:amidohydrolase family protein [Terriglobales bacterium]